MKTSEEQAEAKRLEREQKLKLYQSATQAVFQKVGALRGSPNLRVKYRGQKLDPRVKL